MCRLFSLENFLCCQSWSPYLHSMFCECFFFFFFWPSLSLSLSLSLSRFLGTVFEKRALWHDLYVEQKGFVTLLVLLFLFDVMVALM